MSSGEASVWITKPQEVGQNDMCLLEGMLDRSEAERASNFRFESDRRAYVVAHGLRRIALGDLLDVDPGSLVLSKQNDGRPLLTWPAAPGVSFSHAHTRAVVAFAVSSVSLVGIDVEHVGRTSPELDLLTPYVVLPQADQMIADVGADPIGQFFFYWTALEAFWKSSGKGLSPGNPRICCDKDDRGIFQVKLESDIGERAVGERDFPRAKVSRIEAPDGCVISLAQQYPKGNFGRMGLPRVRAGARSSKKSTFFQRTKRYQDSGFITIVSV